MSVCPGGQIPYSRYGTVFEVECSECFRVIVMAMVQRVLNAGCMPGAADDAGARAGWPAG